MRKTFFLAYCAASVVLIFWFDVWRYLIIDLIPGDAVGFSVPLYVKAIIFIFGIAIAYKLKSYAAYVLSFAIFFIIGLHVSFNQTGMLVGRIFSFLPLGTEIAICKSDGDDALKFLDQEKTNTQSLAHFQRSVACADKTGGIFSYAYLWRDMGSV